MGAFSSFSYTSTLTLWPVTLDDMSQPEKGEPFTVRGTWRQGGPAIRNADSIEFQPNATFWFESTRKPERQWYILEGEHTGNPPEGAELIEHVTGYDVSLFESGSLTDYMVVT